MKNKKLILSSYGIKNIVIEHPKDEFQFIFNENIIRMKTTFAEFISPKVSMIHLSDPTIDSICFNKDIQGLTISKNALSKFQLLSSGDVISINEEESFQMKIISLLLGNEELFFRINILFPPVINEANIDQYLSNLTILFKISPNFKYLIVNDTIKYISSIFYSINIKQLIQLPKMLLYSIISQKELKIESEDSLFEIITQFFDKNNNEAEDDIDITSFYELIEFQGLSEEKFREFIENYDYSELTNNLWKKLCGCFYINKSNNKKISMNESRYSVPIKRFIYEKEPLEGIIDYLTKNKISLNATSSSSCSSHPASCAIDIHNGHSYFQSVNEENSWLMIDFGVRKIHPTHYSILTREIGNGNHPRNWVIEGCNDYYYLGNWKLLDSRQNDMFLYGTGRVHTYQISEDLESNESFRYIRIRQTGFESSYCHYLTIAAIEFFGILFSNEENDNKGVYY